MYTLLTAMLAAGIMIALVVMFAQARDTRGQAVAKFDFNRAKEMERRLRPWDQ